MKSSPDTYWYSLSYTEAEAEIARSEARALLPDAEVHGPVVVSALLRDPDRTAFVSARLVPLARASSAAELVSTVAALGLSAERFKVEVKHSHAKKTTAYHALASALGRVIGGSVDLSNPAVVFRALETKEGWWFGQVEGSSSRRWERFAPGESTFSSAFPPRWALACVNLACPNGGRFLDPCCGSGTLVLQAAGLGLTAVGVDSNPRMVWLTRKNIEKAGLPALTFVADARTLGGQFTGIAANLPYGRYLRREPALYEAIAENLAPRAARLVLVAAEDCTGLWEAAGLSVLEVARAPSGNLTRYIHICAGQSRPRDEP